ncbi:hypothetical protein AU255_01310 [Methyloprofundus sedimenti]|uniref:MASE1 domain-containing protein n=1 Tax=Methyloprofundus sedimenti TaxID=1420851 RepID=A0A1V8M4T3_9GAMM|nr:hypothetical protein AU255_01310 [Methyloprofundus sedimenti]
MQYFRLAGSKQEFLRDLIIMVAWLFFLALVNRYSQFPIYSIFPYLIPACLLTWKYGLSWGFIFSGLASLAAIPYNDLWKYDENSFFWAGLTTYFKLTGFAIGITYSRWRVNMKNKN